MITTDPEDLIGIEVPSLDDLAFLMWVGAEGYGEVKPLPNRRWAGLTQLLFTCAIVQGRMNDRTGYEDRWCYRDRASASAALAAWNGEGEPEGWHRHPLTGRRRKDGHEAQEYHAW